VVSFYIDYLTL